MDTNIFQRVPVKHEAILFIQITNKLPKICPESFGIINLA